MHYKKKSFRTPTLKTSPANCRDCKWRFGSNKEKCMSCGKAQELISFELRREKI